MATFTDRLLVLGTGVSGAGTAGVPQIISSSDNIGITGNLNVGGNLTVVGNIESGGAVDMVVLDHFLDLNHGQVSTTVNGGGGLTVNVRAATGVTAVTSTAFTAGVASGAQPTITTNTMVGKGYAIGDIIQVSGAEDPENNGLFAILTFGATGCTVYGIGTTAVPVGLPFAQNQFKTNASDTGATIIAVDLGVIGISDGVQMVDSNGAIAIGTWCTAYHSPATTTAFATGYEAIGGEPTLAEVTANGHTTATNCDFSGGIDFTTVAPTSTAGFSFPSGTTPSSAVGWNVTAGTSLFTGGQLKFNDTIEAQWGSAADLQIFHTSVGAGSFIQNQTTGGPLTIENQSITGDLICKLGMSTTATSFEVQSAAGTKLMEIAGSGQVDFVGNVDANLGLDVSGGALSFTGTSGSWTFGLATSTLTQTGAGAVTITGATTHGDNVFLSNDKELQFGASLNSEDFSIQHVSATHATEFKNSNVLGSTSFLLGTSSNVTEFNIKKSDATTLFKVDGSGAVTSAGASFDVDCTGNVTLDPDGNFSVGADLSTEDIELKSTQGNIDIESTATAAADKEITLSGQSLTLAGWNLGHGCDILLKGSSVQMWAQTHVGASGTMAPQKGLEVSWSDGGVGSHATEPHVGIQAYAGIELSHLQPMAFRWNSTPAQAGDVNSQYGMLIKTGSANSLPKLELAQANVHDVVVVGFSVSDWDATYGMGYCDMVGQAYLQLDTVPVVGDIGKIIYLSATAAGKASLTAPSGTGETVYRLGILQLHTAIANAPQTVYACYFQPQFIIEIP